jgi:response regulator RpfG family c-di-GMP phosphodiesterase
VVDDEINNLRALRRALRGEYKVFTAANGEDALDILKKEDIAAIIADHLMPEMTGIELLEISLKKYPNTIRVILTSYTSEELLMDAINKTHAHGFISKPWHPEEVKNLIGKWIENYENSQKVEVEIEQLRKQVGKSESKPEKISWWRRLFRLKE